MTVSYRNTIIITCAAVLVIGIVSYIRIRQMTPTVVSFSPSASGSSPQPASTDPLLAPDGSFLEKENPVTSKPALPDPMTARAYIIGNVKTGKIYMESNAAVSLPVASMSKLVTAFVATDELSSTSLITITPAEASTSPDGSVIGAGERFTLPELLYPLLLSSSNIAAEALASSTDRGHFLELMSGYAWEIGMPGSFFADPSGLNPRNRASARDLFALAQYLYKFRPDILTLTRTVQAATATTTDHGSHLFTNIHPFVSDPRFLGGKTGRTPEAGETMMTILNINDQPVAFVILGSQYGRREADTRMLIDRVKALLK